ncbi:MAG: MBL fold metallo-hydrolase [Verrucomicrobia bacterium]|nr:MBL fold metallo-hydrolase [Verrucomicrobiota bacterium]
MQIVHLSKFLTLSLLVAALQPFSAQAADSQAQQSVSVTFIANEGILVAGSQARVVIDGLFTDSYGIFQVPDPITLTKLQAAEPPFDHLTVLLATHKDGDHVTHAIVSQHLLADPDCAFYAPAEVTEMFKTLPEYAQLAGRLHSVTSTGFGDNFLVGDVKIRAIPLPHLPRPAGMSDMPANVGYLFKIDGITFFHTGDTSGDNLAALQRAKLAEANIDVVIINWLAFIPEDGRHARAMLQYLRPKTVLLAHLTRKGAAEEAAKIQKIEGLPLIVLLDTPLREYKVTCEGLVLAVK